MFTNETFHVIDWNPVPTICLIYYTCITCMVRMILTLNSLLCSFDSSWIWLFIRSQIDLRHEAICLEQFGDNFINIANIRFPKPIHPYCKRDVLVETFEVCRFVYIRDLFLWIIHFLFPAMLPEGIVLYYTLAVVICPYHVNVILIFIVFNSYYFLYVCDFDNCTTTYYVVYIMLFCQINILFYFSSATFPTFMSGRRA